MTAPLKHSADITVDVAPRRPRLDIVIGRGVLASLGPRVAAFAPRRAHPPSLRPTGQALVEPAEVSLPRPASDLTNHRRGRRGVEDLCRPRKVSEALIGGQDRAQRSGDCARRRVVGDLAGFAAAS